MSITFEDETQPNARRCGGCTLCCRLLPMKARPHFETMEVVRAMIERGIGTPKDFAGMIPDFDKPAGERCNHQRTGKGCAIYGKRPFGCRFWNCAWLANADTADLRRPDRSHYVVDIAPDYVTMQPHDGSPPTHVEVIQVWCDPAHRNAWHDPALLAYLDRRGKDGAAAIIRFDSGLDAIILFPPSMSADGQWHEETSGQMMREHTAEEKVAAIGSARRVKVVS